MALELIKYVHLLLLYLKRKRAWRTARCVQHSTTLLVGKWKLVRDCWLLSAIFFIFYLFCKACCISILLMIQKDVKKRRMLTNFQNCNNLLLVTKVSALELNLESVPRPRPNSKPKLFRYDHWLTDWVRWWPWWCCQWWWTVLPLSGACRSGVSPLCLRLSAPLPVP